MADLEGTGKNQPAPSNGIQNSFCLLVKPYFEKSAPFGLMSKLIN